MIDFLIIVAKVLIVFGGLLGAAAVMTLADRRFSAFVQDRLGPNRAGPEGLLQPIADLVKLIFKEQYTPARVEKRLFALAPLIILLPACITFAVIPVGQSIEVFGRTVQLQLADLNVGILYIFAITSLGVYGLVLGGWSANNKYALLGGLRSSAQMISYELSLGLAVVGVLMITGSLRPSEIVLTQTQMMGGVIPAWNIIVQPLGFLIFLVSAFAETNRLPFDLPEAEQELVGGYHTEFSSMRFAFFFLAEYINLTVASAMVVTLFLGGWHFPFIDGWLQPGILLELIHIGAFLAKTGAVLFFFVLVRWTMPRFKYNQLMHLGWKVMLPLAFLNVIVTGVYLVLTHG